MGDRISWHVELFVMPGELENFRALTHEMVKSAECEDGVRIFERYASADGKTIHILERYKDSASAVEHLESFDTLYSDRFSRLVERRSFIVFGDPSDELRRILDRYGALYFGLFDGFYRFQ